MKVFRYVFIVAASIFLLILYEWCTSGGSDWKLSRHYDLAYLQDSGLYVGTYVAQNSIVLYDSIHHAHDSIWLIHDFVMHGQNIVKRTGYAAFVLPSTEKNSSFMLVVENNKVVMSHLRNATDIASSPRTGGAISKGQAWVRGLGYVFSSLRYSVKDVEDTVVMKFSIKYHSPITGRQEEYIDDADIFFVRVR